MIAGRPRSRPSEVALSGTIPAGCQHWLPTALILFIALSESCFSFRSCSWLLLNVSRSSNRHSTGSLFTVTLGRKPTPASMPIALIRASRNAGFWCQRTFDPFQPSAEQTAVLLLSWHYRLTGVRTTCCRQWTSSVRCQASACCCSISSRHGSPRFRIEYQPCRIHYDVRSYVRPSSWATGFHGGNHVSSLLTILRSPSGLERLMYAAAVHRSTPRLRVSAWYWALRRCRGVVLFRDSCSSPYSDMEGGK